jgi:hypothetical protein
MCFVAKSPQPTARIVGLSDPRIVLEDFEYEVLPLVSLPDAAMPWKGLEEGDTFYQASRKQIRDKTWTWMGRYRHATDPGGRDGAYICSGILLPDQICNALSVAAMLAALDEFVLNEVLDLGRIPPNWWSTPISSAVKKRAFQTDNQMGPQLIGGGLSAQNNKLIYVRGSNPTADRLATIIQAVQSDERFQLYGTVIFGPSAQFAEKLDSKPELEVFSQQAARAAPAGVGSRQQPAQQPAATVAPSANKGVSKSPPPTSPSPQSTPRLEVPDGRGIDRSLQELRSELETLRRTLADEHEANLVNRRLAWLGAVALLLMLVVAGYLGSSFVDNSMRNAMGQVYDEFVRHDRNMARTATDQLGPESSAEFKRLEVHIEQIQASLKKLDAQSEAMRKALAKKDVPPSKPHQATEERHSNSAAKEVTPQPSGEPSTKDAKENTPSK